MIAASGIDWQAIESLLQKGLINVEDVQRMIDPFMQSMAAPSSLISTSQPSCTGCQTEMVGLKFYGMTKWICHNPSCFPHTFPKDAIPITSPAPTRKPCDCGALKAKTTHSNWCSAK